MNLEHLVEHFGLPLLFFGSGIEGEAVAATGGLLAHRGVLPLWKVAMAVFGGSWLQGQLLFVLGRGLRTLPKMTKLLAAPACAGVLSALEAHPATLMLTFRFLFGLRSLSPLAMGASTVSPAMFSVLNVCGAALWTVVFLGLGYGVGSAILSVWGRLPAFDHFLIGGAVCCCLCAAFIVWRIRNGNRGGRLLA
ncbi:DedA family protein [Brevundimonas sp.]|uniref:DedA family protein n=1 Tax=Brevundimonas sp. TaxID=1871086 RepID=UPI00289ECA34|nr:VTT domain-containing protein [Brevundimonas sp.]